MHGKNKWERAIKTDLPPGRGMPQLTYVKGASSQGCGCCLHLCWLECPTAQGLPFLASSSSSFFFNMYLFGCIGSWLWHENPCLWHVGSRSLTRDRSSNSGPLRWEHRVLATGPPRKSLWCLFNHYHYTLIMQGRMLIHTYDFLNRMSFTR